jgi:uncharacterized Zn-finger protein
MKTKNNNIVYSDTRKVRCSGSEGNLGHPLVYLTIKQEKIICPYCSREFIYKEPVGEKNLKVK